MDFENEDVTEEVVQPTENQEENAKNVVVEGEQESIPQETPKLVQSQEENAIFAVARRKQELEEARQRLQAEQSEKEQLITAMHGIGYEGSSQEIIDQLESEKRQVPVENVKAEREIREKNNLEIATLKRANDELMLRDKERLNREADRAKSEDLKVLQAINPQLKSVEELGEDFLTLRFATNKNGDFLFTPAEAYNALMAKKKQPSTGDINVAKADNKAFFTRDDVMKMSQAEVSKNYEAIKKAQELW